MLKLAFRNTLRNKRRTILTMLSMFGGFFMLSASLSIQLGTYEQIIDVMTQDSTGHAQISESGYQEKPTLHKSVPATDTFYQALMAQPYVAKATSRIVSGALAYGPVKSFPVQVIGVDVQKEADMTFLEDKIKSGRYLSEQMNSDGYYETIIGAFVARQLGITLGDELILISQGADGSIANDLYDIVGIVGSTDGAQARNVYLPLAAAQDFFVMTDNAHYWAVLTDSYHNSDGLSDQLNVWLAQGSGASSSLESNSWKVVSKDFYAAMKADIEGGYVSFYIIIMLVCIGVLNTVLMSVLERTGEFGVLKAIGTSPSRLFSLIVTETMLISGFSVLCGLILVFPLVFWLSQTGISLPEPIEFSGITMEHMQGTLNLKVFYQPALIVLSSTLLVSIFPAMRAAKIVPVEAMRRL